MISFIDVFLRHTEGKHVMVIVPVNTLQNWSSEFQQWIPKPPKDHVPPTPKAKPATTPSESTIKTEPSIKTETMIKTEPGISTEQTNTTTPTNTSESIPDNKTEVKSEDNKEEVKPKTEPKPPEEPYDKESTTYRSFGVHLLNDNLRTMAARAKVVGLYTTTLTLKGVSNYNLLDNLSSKNFRKYW